MQAMEELSCRLTDLLQGIKPLKAMHCEHLLTPILERESEEIYAATRKQIFAKYGLSTMREPIAAVVLAIGFYILLGRGGINMAELITTAILFHRISVTISSAQQAYQLIGTSEHCYRAIMALTETAKSNREPDRLGKILPPSDWNMIRICNLSFAYGDKQVLDSVSLDIPRGKFTAIFGPSGSGKTTLTDIVCGIAMPKSGDICIGDISIRDIDLVAWRQMIGYVPQELFLFHDTILSNVSLKDPEISRSDVEQAIRGAGAEHFVRDLPQGLDTIIGERGLMLSGGQRQRIAIARALARRPQILILDEATTALDPKTEREILNTLKALSGDVTIVAISHQTAVREAADCVFQLDNVVANKAH